MESSKSKSPAKNTTTPIETCKHKDADCLCKKKKSYAENAYTNGFILATAAMMNDLEVVRKARDAAILASLNSP